MKIEIDYKHGQTIYLKGDFEQRPYKINRIIIEQKNLITLELFSPNEADYFEVAEINVSKERDESLLLGIEKKEIE